MRGGTSNAAIAAQLLLTMVLWGANNVGVKYQIRFWPPIFTVSTRFVLAGALLLAVMHWTDWLGRPASLDVAQRRTLWLRGAVPLAGYIVLFVSVLQWTSASAVALFMGASPVWALLWEERLSRHSARRYAAAALALAGVVVLFLPSLRLRSEDALGNALALGASVMWTVFSRGCRDFGGVMTGLELTGRTFWRAGVLLLPVAAFECAQRGVVWHAGVVALQAYAVLFSGLLAFGLWNHALQVWPTSRVFLFGNLIPVTTMFFAWAFLGEPVTVTFWAALSLILGAVLVSR